LNNLILILSSTGKPSTTTEPSNPAYTTQKITTSNPSTGSIEDRISLLENKVENITTTSDQMIANWKNQYLLSASNQDEIGRLKNIIFNLQNNSENKDKLINEILAENLRLKNVTINMQTNIDGILKDKEILEKSFQNSIVSLTTQLQNLQSQVRPLLSCVSCN